MARARNRKFGSGVHKVGIELTAKTEAAKTALANVRKEYAEMLRTQRAAARDADTSAARGGGGVFGRLASGAKAAQGKIAGLGQALGGVSGMLAMGGLTGAAVMAVDKIDDLMGHSQKLKDVMGNLPFAIDDAKKATQGLVSEFDLSKQAMTANMLGAARTSKEFEKLARIGSVLARAQGKEAASGVEDLTVALARQSPMILDNLGISIKLEKAYEDYAATLKKTASELTDEEKKQAFQNAALARGEELASRITVAAEGMGPAWERSKIAIVDFANESVMALDRAFVAAQRFWKYGLNPPDEASEQSKARARVEEIARREEDEQYRRQLVQDRLEVEARGTYGGQFMAQFRQGQKGLAAEREKRTREWSKRRDTGKQRAGAKKKDLLEGAFDGETGGLDEMREAWAAEEEAKREHERALAEISMQERMRAAEAERAAGVDPVIVAQHKTAAAEEYLQLRMQHSEHIVDAEARELEQAQIRAEWEQAQHEVKMERLEEERQAAEKNAEVYKRLGIATATALLTSAVAAARSADGASKAFFKSVQAYASAKAVEMGLLAAVEFAQAAAAAASYRYVAAAQHTAAGAQALGASALATSIALGARAIGGAIGRRGRGDRGYGAAAFGPGGGYGGGGGSNGGDYGGARETGGTPRAYKPPEPVAPSKPEQGGGVVVQIKGIVAATPEELGHHVSKALRAAGNKLGAVR